MGVLDMKPHCLFYWDLQESQVDSNGDKHEVQPVLKFCCRCDLKPAGTAREIQFEDGIVDTYSYTIYLPASCRDFKHGDEIVVRHYDKERHFTVKGFQRYQLQCKIWV